MPFGASTLAEWFGRNGSAFFQLLLDVVNIEPSDALLELLANLLLQPHGTATRAVVLAAEVLPALAEGMRRSNSLFASGAEMIRGVLIDGTSEQMASVAQGAGFATLIDIIRATDDIEAWDQVTRSLVQLFESEHIGPILAPSAALAHLTVLVETSESDSEIEWALGLVAAVVQHETYAMHFVEHGGLRAMVELCVFRHNAAEQLDVEHAPVADKAVSTLAVGCLEKLLGFRATLAHQLNEDGGGTVLLSLLDTPLSDNVTVLALEVLANLVDGAAASDILDSGGIYQLSFVWKSSRSKTTLTVAAQHMWAGRALVNLAWNVRLGGRGRTTFQGLALVVEQGGLAAWVEHARVAAAGHQDADECRRRALWAIASWLSVEHTDAKVKFVMAGGLQPMLEITPENSSIENQRYAELALSKILCARGEELAFRTEVLQLQMSAAVTDASKTALWSTIAQHFLQ
jgi:hypothetical protein